MTPLDLAAVGIQLVVPLALIARVALLRRSADVALEAAFVALYLVAIALAGLWLALPRALVAVLGLTLAAAAARALPRARERRGTRVAARRSRVRLALSVAAVVAASAVVVESARGRRPLPGEPLDLAFPLGTGSYLVASGGSTSILNPHLATLERHRARPWRGQSYALDLVRLGRWGSRAGIGAGAELAGRPAAHAIFGDPVAAPCDGTVVRALDGTPDVRPAGAAPERLEGNHVILECRGRWVVLAHLQRGSVRVADGQRVAAGAPLGRVGNSGRSDEPHLHIHAQTPGTAGEPLSGDPIPITFDGRQLVRNDRVHESRRSTPAVDPAGGHGGVPTDDMNTELTQER